MSFIDDHHKELGIEPICRELAIAPSSYHTHAARLADPDKRSARVRRDDKLRAQIGRVHEASFGLYGTRKVWHQLRREGIKVAKCTVERLMRGMGLAGIRRGKTTITTVSNPKAPCPLDKVNREFQVSRPNALWVVDFTYVHTWTGFVYVAFVIDAFARRIVGWKVSTSATAGFVLDALEQAIHARRPSAEDALIHHSDRGVQYLAMSYTRRLAEAEPVPSVGSVGDSYDNALAETINGLYKAEVIWRQRSWPNASAVEMATLRWVAAHIGDHPEPEHVHAAVRNPASPQGPGDRDTAPRLDPRLRAGFQTGDDFLGDARGGRHAAALPLAIGHDGSPD